MDRTDKTEILTQLAALAGRQFQEDQIERKGSTIVLPATMTVRTGIETLIAYQKEQETEQVYTHQTRFRFFDGLVAMKRVLRRMTGMTRGSKRVVTLFGSYQPPTLNVPISVDEHEEAVTGEIPIEIFEGTVEAGHWVDKEMGTLFQLRVTAPAKYRSSVQGFFKLLDEELETNSIYRGKAITAEETPTFLDLRGVNPDNVVYSEEVLTQLDANIWSLVEHTDAMRENKLPLKRAILLEGPYGTGKTLAAYLTAQRAVEHGWTFIFVRPGKDDLGEAMATAQLYQPSVVFFEDIDITSTPDQDVSNLLDLFDGIQAKGTEIVAVLTTNHADRIHKGLVRPGRLDAVIHIGELDAPGIEKLIRATVDEKWLPETLDLDPIASAMEGFMPAFVKEAIDRAVRYSIARNDGHPSALTNDDFINAGLGLRPQLDLMNGAKEEVERPALDTSIRNAVAEVLGDFRVVMDSASYEEQSRRKKPSDWFGRLEPADN